MVRESESLIADFIAAMAQSGASVTSLVAESQPAPHQPHPLPPGKCAVYVFTLSEAHGSGCPAGPHRTLKVGKAGPNSNARFQSQHYNPRSAQNTLAAALLESRGLWAYLGIGELSEEEVRLWITRNTDRNNFYLDAHEQGSLLDLERYLRARLGPVFEGGYKK